MNGNLSLILLSADPLDHVLPHPLFKIGGLVVTNQMFMSVVAAGLMLLIFPRLFKTPETNPPRGAKNFFEAILEFLRIEVIRPALKENTDRFVPFLWTLFFFILFSNLLGLIPIGEFITLISGGHESHIGGTATGAITTTAALAICAFFAIHASGVIQVARALIDGTYGHHHDHADPGYEDANGLDHHRGEGLAAAAPGDVDALTNPTAHYHDGEHHGKHQHPEHDDHGHGQPMSPAVAWALALPLYLWNFAPHVFKPAKGQPQILWAADVLMWAFLLILELVGALIKPFALMIRLFANMIAGHIVLAALILLIPVGSSIATQIGIGLPVTLLSLMIRMLELFVAFLQAYIFTFLTTLFLASAVAPEH